MPNVAKLLLFPKPAPLDTFEHTITLCFGADTYAMTIHAEIERVTALPMDIPPPDFECGRELGPVATVGAPAPDVAARVGKTSKKATRSEKPATSEPLAKVARKGARPNTRSR